MNKHYTKTTYFCFWYGNILLIKNTNEIMKKQSWSHENIMFSKVTNERHNGYKFNEIHLQLIARHMTDLIICLLYLCRVFRLYWINKVDVHLLSPIMMLLVFYKYIHFFAMNNQVVNSIFIIRYIEWIHFILFLAIYITKRSNNW